MISHLELFFQLLLAAVLGGLIGLERERKSWFAGLRTHMLVCIGSTLVMIVSQYGFENNLHRELIVLDPSRIAAQVVSGIGFLGAGTIIFWKNKIKGLTTAASLWVVSGVGLAIGGGLYLASFITTILILITLAVLKPIESLFFKSDKMKEIQFSADQGFSLLLLDSVLNDLNLGLTIVDMQIDKEKTKEIVKLVVAFKSEIDFLKLLNEIKKLPIVDKIESLE